MKAPHPLPDGVMQQAIHWACRLLSGDCSAHDQAAFAAWQAASPAHAGAYARVMRVWDGVGVAAAAMPRALGRAVEKPAGGAGSTADTTWRSHLPARHLHFRFAGA